MPAGTHLLTVINIINNTVNNNRNEANKTNKIDNNNHTDNDNKHPHQSYYQLERRHCDTAKASTMTSTAALQHQSLQSS